MFLLIAIFCRLQELQVKQIQYNFIINFNFIIDAQHFLKLFLADVLSLNIISFLL